MKNTIKILINLAVFLMLIVPAVSLGQEDPGLVRCGKAGQAPCDWNGFMDLINRVISFLLFKLAVPIAAIMFAYAGFKMITAGEEAAGARTQAKEIFVNTLLGLVFAVGAWIIINTLLTILGYDGTWIGL